MRCRRCSSELLWHPWLLRSVIVADEVASVERTEPKQASQYQNSCQIRKFVVGVARLQYLYYDVLEYDVLV
jgi:hypothetical protein